MSTADFAKEFSMFLAISLATICQIGFCTYLIITDKVRQFPWDDLLIEDYLIAVSATWGTEWYCPATNDGAPFLAYSRRREQRRNDQPRSGGNEGRGDPPL